MPRGEERAELPVLPCPAAPRCPSWDRDTRGGKEDTCRWQESLKEEGAELCPFTLGPGPRLWDLKRGSSTDASAGPTVSTMGETLSLTWP